MTGPARPRAVVVVDLGFGDAGKGLATDALVRRHGARVVVRWNGGAQAGHNVVAPDGRHHTFSQLGAGSFVPGVRTVLAAPVVVHPTALRHEADALARRGVPDPLARVLVDERARLVTPWHQAANRLRELARGDARHGSCGVGVGEAVADALAHRDDVVVAGDLRDRAALAARVRRVRDRVRASLDGLALPATSDVEAERAVFDDPTLPTAWVAWACAVARCVASPAAIVAALRAEPVLVLEGAQGVLLDETHGFHPHTTWSDCTPAAARRVLYELAPDAAPEVLGVLRAHGVRHGPGPFPTAHPAVSAAVVEHNATNAWQGSVRHGWFDGVLSRYALAVVGGVDALLLTHVDALARRASWRVAASYELPDDAPADLVRRDAAGRADLVAATAPSLERQARLAGLLARCAPVLDEVPADERGYVGAVERVLGRRVDAVARGPTAADVEDRDGGGARR